MTRWRSWRAAMEQALYGPDGFYRATGAPARHFRTSPVAAPLFAAAARRLVTAVDDALDRPATFTVVDMAAGGGELVAALTSDAPDRWRLVGVEVAPRPAGLPERVEWLADVPEPVTGVVVANEWLDNVPLDVVEVDDDTRMRVVEVAHDGSERLGPVPDRTDADWLGRWWRPTHPAERAEVGRPRDEAWAGVVRRLAAGLAVAIDYRARPTAHPVGTLTGYRDGRRVAPVPDGRTDLTAHVLLESCAAAGAAAGVEDTLLVSQRDALLALLDPPGRPSYDDARADPLGYLRALSARGELAELTDPTGLGGFGWLVQSKGCPLPPALAGCVRHPHA